MTTEYEKYRGDPHRYRQLQAAALTKLFKQERGRAPETLQELEEWLPGSGATDADPFKVLTEEEIAAALEEGG